MGIKTYLYDWFGYNTTIFHAMYNSFAPVSAKAVSLFSTAFGEYKLFPIHFIILLLFLSVKYKDISSKRHIMLPLATLVASYIAGALCVHAIKVYFHYQRPCSLLLLDFLYNDNCDGKSFPSGHAWYVGTFVYSMWDLMSTRIRVLAATVCVLVAYSRVALGMHFPADVLYGCILGLSVVSIVRPIVAKRFKPNH